MRSPSSITKRPARYRRRVPSASRAARSDGAAAARNPSGSSSPRPGTGRSGRTAGRGGVTGAAGARARLGGSQWTVHVAPQ